MLNILYRNIDRLTIKSQVMAISILSIIGVACLGGASLYTANLVATATSKSVEYSKLASQLHKINEGGLQLRRHEKDYLVRLSDKYETRYLEQVEKSLIDVAQLEQIINAENLPQIAVISNGIAHHKTQFTKVIAMGNNLGIAPEQGLQGELRAAIHFIEDELKKLETTTAIPAALDKISVQMLMLRRHEKDFMLRVSEKYLKKFNDRIATFTTVVNDSTLLSQDKAELLREAKVYSDKFGNWSQMRLAFNEEVSELSHIYSEFSPVVNHLIENFEALSLSSDNQRIAAGEFAKTLLIASIAVIATLLTLISILIASNIVQKIKSLSAAMSDIAHGNNHNEIEHHNLGNEIGVMAKSLLVFQDSALARIQAEQEAQKMNDEELRKASHVSRLIEEFQTVSIENIELVHSASKDLESASTQLDQSASKMSHESQIVSQNVDDTNMNVSGAASATEEMVASISEISHQAASSNDLAISAKNKTNETVKVINALAVNAQHIEQVVKLIEEIAEQTNLLALNATIEAARAGESGRGFAVVANEVKSLASQTAKATDEIAQQVTTIQRDSKQASLAIEEVETIISNLSDASLGVAAAVEEQAAAIDEIASNVTMAATLSTQSSESMQAVGQSIEDTKNVSGNVSGLASSLNGQITKLQSDISQFLDDVKSA